MKRHGLHVDRRQPLVPNRVHDGILVGYRLEHLGERTEVSPVGGGRHAEKPRFREVVDHGAIRSRQGVMALVDDDQRELVRGEPRKPLLRLHRLHGADDDGVRNLVNRHVGRFLGLFEPGLDACRGTELRNRLRQQFAAMGEDEDAASAPHLPRGKVRKDDGLSASRRKDDERGAEAARELRLYGGNGLILVRAQFHQ